MILGSVNKGMTHRAGERKQTLCCLYTPPPVISSQREMYAIAASAVKERLFTFAVTDISLNMTITKHIF